MKKVVCQSSSDGVTRAYARKLIERLTRGGALLLQGELGAGKTTFVQGLAEALGVDHTVTSPTFTLMNVYETRHPVIQQLIHIDLYRLTGSGDMAELDIASWLANPQALVVIEWPERSPDLNQNALGLIQFALGDTMSQRVLTIEGEVSDYFLDWSSTTTPVTTVDPSGFFQVLRTRKKYNCWPKLKRVETNQYNVNPAGNW